MPRLTLGATAKTHKPAQRSKLAPARKCPQNQPDTPKNKFAGKLEKKAKKEQN
jgi:hypothetical protein